MLKKPSAIGFINPKWPIGKWLITVCWLQVMPLRWLAVLLLVGKASAYTSALDLAEQFIELEAKVEANYDLHLLQRLKRKTIKRPRSASIVTPAAVTGAVLYSIMVIMV